MERFDYHPACLGGIETAVFGADAHPGAPVVFFAHGRTGAMHHGFRYCQELAEGGLIAVTFDQRNHGRRTVDPRCNGAWDIHSPADLYGMITGTAMDISLLIDLLPARLGISAERVGMTGISMGGHATLIAMALDSRIHVGAAMIGSGDYRQLMALRAQANAIPAEDFPQFFPNTLQHMVHRYDPIHHPERFADRPLLLTNGEDDSLVQIVCNRHLEAALRPYYTHPERLRLSPYPGLGHTVPEEMWQEAKQWLLHWLAGYTPGTQAHLVDNLATQPIDTPGVGVYDKIVPQM